jgi:hypothetical protein
LLCVTGLLTAGGGFSMRKQYFGVLIIMILSTGALAEEGKIALHCRGLRQEWTFANGNRKLDDTFVADYRVVIDLDARIAEIDGIPIDGIEITSGLIKGEKKWDPKVTRTVEIDRYSGHMKAEDHALGSYAGRIQQIDANCERTEKLF